MNQPRLAGLRRFLVGPSSPLALLGATALDRIALLVIHGLLARVLTTEGFAGFALAYALASIATRVGDGGLSIATIRLLSSPPPSSSDRTVSTAVAIRGVLAGAALAVVAAAAALLRYDAPVSTTAALLTLALSVSSLAQLILTPFRAANELRREAWVNVIGTIARLGAVAGYVVTAPPGAVSSVGAATALGAGSLIHWGAAVAAARLRYGVRLVALDRELLTQILGSSWPLAVAVLLIMAQSRVGLFLLEAYSSADQVALFAAALTIVSGLAIIPDSFSVAMYPRLCRHAFNMNDGQFLRLAAATATGNALIGIAIAGALVLFSTPVLSIAYGSKFVPAGPILRLLAVAFVCGALSSVAGDSLNALGRARANMVVVGVGLLATVLVAVFLTPRYGGAGAAVAYLIGIGSIMLGLWIALAVFVRARPAPPASLPVSRESTFEAHA